MTPASGVAVAAWLRPWPPSRSALSWWRGGGPLPRSTRPPTSSAAASTPSASPPLPPATRTCSPGPAARRSIAWGVDGAGILLGSDGRSLGRASDRMGMSAGPFTAAGRLWLVDVGGVLRTNAPGGVAAAASWPARRYGAVPGGRRRGGRLGRLGQPTRRRRLCELGGAEVGNAWSTRWGVAVRPLASLLGDARTATYCYDAGDWLSNGTDELRRRQIWRRRSPPGFDVGGCRWWRRRLWRCRCPACGHAFSPSCRGLRA